MATLTQLYEETDAKRVSVVVRIGGVLVMDVLSAEWSFALQQVPSATVRVPNPHPATAVFGASVTIDAGFNDATARVFTGTVLNINPDETECEIECQGKSQVLENYYHKIVVTIDGSKTAEEWVEYLLDQAGVVDYHVDLPNWTPGTVSLSPDPDKEHTVLTFQTYAEAITKIAEVDGGGWFESPTGAVIVRVIEPVPALTSWRNYFSMSLAGTTEVYPAGITTGRPRLHRIRATERAQDVKNRCYVEGATYTQVNADGTESAIEVEGDASAPSPWVKNPDGTQAYNDELFSNELIDTAAKAGEVAGRIVALKNRLLVAVDADVNGDPQVSLGSTVRVEDPDYTATTGRWFVGGYTTRVDEGDFVTSLSVLGGAEAGGAVNIAPWAVFTYVVDYEVMGDRVWAIVTFDASGSTDPDGSITDYDFIDNQVPHVIDVNGANPIQTVAFDPAAYVDPLEVTLTVTDNDGATDTITLTVAITPTDASVVVPALFVAFDAYFSASPDGGQTWNDQAAPGGDSVISVAAKYEDGVTSGVAVYGTNLGALYRTADFCATAPVLVMVACGWPITHVCWDWNHPGIVWACSRNGKLFWSWDNGITWALYDDLAALWGLTDIRLQRIGTPVPNGVWVWGGTGTGYPLIAWDAILNHNWTGATLGGELLADVEGAGASSGQGIIGYQGHDSKLCSLGAGSWGLVSNIAVGGTHAWNQLVNIDGILFRTDSRFDDPCPGSLYRSTNGGANWTLVKAGADENEGLHSITKDVNGVYWAQWGRIAAPYTCQVYKSLNQGATWNYVATLGDTSIVGVGNIACHPTDPLKIAVLAVRSSGFIRVYYSDDGGGSWSEWTTGIGTHTSSMYTCEILWGESDRLIMSVGGNGDLIYWSTPTRLAVDDEDWTGACNNTTGQLCYTRQFIHGATVGEFFKVWTSVTPSRSYISRSVDNGATWDIDWATTDTVVFDSLSDAKSIAWDPSENALYWAEGNQGAGADEIVYKWTNTGGWVNVSYNLNAVSSGDDGAARNICAKVGGVPAPSDLYIADAAAFGGITAIILNSSTVIPAVYCTDDIFNPTRWKRCLSAPADPRGQWLAGDWGAGIQHGVGQFVFGYDNSASIYRGDVTAGVMTASVAPAAMDAGDECNYGLPLGVFQGIWGLANTYVLAAEGTADGTLYKSWDRFDTIDKLRPATGFPACLAGMNAKMVAVGAENLHPEAVVRIAITHDVGGATTWDASYSNADLSSWQNVALPSNVTHERPEPICLTSLLWFVANVGGFPKPTSKSALTECNREMARTQDGGATWDSIAIGDETCASERAESGDEINHLSRICRDAGGRLWAARQRGSNNTHPIRCEVWYSDNDGDDWTLSTTLTKAGTNEPPIALLAHPSNQNIIVLVSAHISGTDGDNRVVIHYTVNRGASWTTNRPSVASGDNFAHTENGNDSRRQLLPNGRLVIANRELTSSHAKIYTSDDYGLVWTLRWTDALADEDSVVLFRQGQWLGGGNHLVAARVPMSSGVAGMFAVMESPDSGATWSVRTLSEPPGVQYDNDWDVVYDPDSDAMFFQDGGNVGAPGSNRILRLQNATNGGDTWEDMTADLPWVNANMHWNGICLIPNTGGSTPPPPPPPPAVEGIPAYVQQSPATSGTYPRRVAYANSAASYQWENKTDPASANQEVVVCLRRFGTVLFRIVCSDDPQYYLLHPGQLQRSTDNGATWANVGPTPTASGAVEWGVNDICEDADGILWLCCCWNGDPWDGWAGAPSAVYKSTNNGSTWTVSRTLSVPAIGNYERAISVAAHPTDADVIAAIGDTYIGGIPGIGTQYTVNGGAAWNSNTTTAVSSATGTVKLAVLAGSRLVMAKNSSRGYYSDDYGATWTQASGQAMSNNPTDLLATSGGTLYVTSNIGYFNRSTDNGQSWALIFNFGLALHGLTYSEALDKVAIATSNSGGTGRVYIYDEATGVITDVTRNLPALWPTATVGIQGVTT